LRGPTEREAWAATDLLECRVRGARGSRGRGGGDAVRGIPRSSRPAAARARGGAAGIPGGRALRFSGRSLAVRGGTAAGEPDRVGDARGGDLRPVPGPRRRPAGRRPDGPERL